MGRKVKKTKWRTLEIPASGTAYTENGGSKWDDGQRTPSTNNNNININHNQNNHNNHNHNNNTTTTTTNTNTNINSHQHQYERTNVRRKPSPSPSPTARSSNLYSSKQEVKGLVEDEYTKITTPRQDVLFKKGYLTRRKVPETISENSVDQNNDGIAQDCSSNEDFSNCANGDESVQFVCPGPQSYIDPSALYYGGGYEIYDPYTGNVTVIVGPGVGQYPANASCQPVLTSVPCRPVPLQPVQWFNPVPSSDWCCPYSSPSDKRYSTDSQNGSGMGSESSGVPESPPEMIEETMNGNNGPVFPPSYVYPGYMFGASIYNVDDVNTEYYAPESPALSTSELTTSKRRRKKKRRRRTEAEDESESSFDDNCSRSISSTEFILDSSHLPTESQHHHDFEELFVAAECTSSAIAAVPFPSFPHPNVNAPEFVPTSIELALSLKNASSLADCDNRSSSNSVIGSCHDESPSKKTSVLNVYCGESYQERHHQKKRDDSESVSCSNNSDSGISSPGSEDISKNGFGQKESKAHQSDESGKSKKSRSRKSTSGKTTKSKQTNNSDEARKSSNPNQLKTITCIVPTYRESKRDARAGAGNDDKRDSKKSTVNAGKSAAATAKKATATAVTSRNKEKKNETVIAPKSDSKRTTPEKKKGAKKVVTTEDVVTVVVDEQLPFEIHSQLVLDGHEDDDDERVDISSNFIDDTTKPTTPNEETNVTKMLNEYVKIEEKPILVKLVDLNAEVRVSDDLMDEFSTMSEFSSCRESSPLQPPQTEAVASDHRHFVELTAKQVVNEIIDRAEERVLSSMSCDKLQLPITEAVTKWLNEHGGLSVVTENVYDESRADGDDETAAVACASFSEKSATAAVDSKRSKKSKQNCVIC